MPDRPVAQRCRSPDGRSWRLGSARPLIEDYKAWVSAKHGRYTGKPLNRVSVKNRLVNLHCFFDRITEWGYPDPPQRPLIFSGDYRSSTSLSLASSTTPLPRS